MRLSDNVYVDGTMWPTGCRPPEQIAERIGEHAWEDGEPTVAAPVRGGEPDVAVEAAPEVNPATLDGALMGVLDDDEPQTAPVDPEPAELAPPVASSATPDVDVPIPAATLPEPPRVGRGASKAAWTEYAVAHGVPVPEDYKLADIIGVVDAILAQRAAVQS